MRNNLSRWLNKEYPHIPSADRSKHFDHISAKRPGLVGKAALGYPGIDIESYVWDRYTRFSYHDRNDGGEAIELAREEIKKILASWRGEE